MEKFQLAPLSISSNAITTFETWSRWKRSLTYLIDAKGITSHTRKKAILLHKGGTALQDIYATLEKAKATEAAAAKDEFLFAIELLDAHFSPTVNRIYERYKFRLIHQNAESIEQFVVRLRYQAENCEFKEMDTEIVDQIVLGTSSNELRTKILEQRLEALDKVLQLGKLLESVSFQTGKMANIEFPVGQSQEQDSVARLVDRQNSQRSELRNRPSCEACGRRHATGSAECPAKDGTCFRCDAKGHFANRCPSRPGKSQSSSSEQPKTAKQSRPTASKGVKRDEVKLIKSSSAASGSDDEVSHDESDYSFALSSSSDDLPEQLRENRVRIKVGGVNLSMAVDSCSSRALLDASTWRSLLRRKVRYRPAIIESNIYPYGKRRPLDVERAVYLDYESSSALVSAKTYILAESENQCEPIIGSRLAKRLNILRVGEGIASDAVAAVRDFSEDSMIRQMVIQMVGSTAAGAGKLRNFQLSLPLDKSVTPVAQGCRRIPFALRKPLLERTNKLLKYDIIERVIGATPWVSNIVPTVKKNGELRVCVDMRRANQAVQRERYPIPTFDEIIADLHNCSVFSKIDLESAYHQVELDEASREITTFVTPDGLFRFKRLFFGIRCAPEIFQRIMQDTLRDLPFVRVFFDDIIIFSKNHSEHISHVQQVVQRLTEKGLKLNVQKSIFGAKQIEFLGHKIAENVVAPNDANVSWFNKFRVSLHTALFYPNSATPSTSKEKCCVSLVTSTGRGVY